MGCMKQGGSTTMYKVPAEPDPIIDRFIAEAAKRGHSIEKKNLIIQYTSGSDGSVRKLQFFRFRSWNPESHFYLQWSAMLV